MFNANLVNMNAQSTPALSPGIVPAPAPDKTPEPGVAPAPDKTPEPGVAPAAPEIPSSLKSIFAKHGVKDEKSLDEYLDNLSGLKNKIGGKNPDDLLKAYELSQKYAQDKARQERESLKANETPEQTVARLERELDKQNRMSARKEEQARQSQAAQEALTAYSSLVDASLSSIPDLPAEYAPMVKAIMGVDSEVNDLDITDRNSVFSLTQKVAKSVIDDFAKAVINRYRNGKETLPIVPSPSGGNEPGGPGENKPKNLSEAHKLAASMLAKHFSNRG